MPKSRNLVTFPRWSRTAAGVDVGSPDVVEPPGQKKDTGWIDDPAEVPVRSWWNWIWREAFKAFLYFEDIIGGLSITVAQVARSGKVPDTLALTRTDTFEVTIATGEAYVDGAQYTFPQAVISHGSQVSFTTRHDIFVAELVGGVPTITQVIGIAEATDPVLTASQVPLHRLRLGNGPGGSNSPTDDIREFGVVESDRLQADLELRAGVDGAGHVLRVEPGVNPVVAIGEPGQTPALQFDVSQAGLFAPGLWAFQLPLPLARVELAGAQFLLGVGVTTDPSNLDALMSTAELIHAIVSPIPAGARIRTVTMYVNKALTNDDVVWLLIRRNKLTGAQTTVVTAFDNTTSGNITIAADANHLILADHQYMIRVSANVVGATEIRVRGMTVEYELSEPFGSY